MDRRLHRPEQMVSRQPQPGFLVDLVDWAALIASIKGDEVRGQDELHRVFSGGIRFYLSRRFGPQQLEVTVRETFTMLVSAIQAEELRDREALVGLVRTIVMKQVVACSNEEELPGRPDKTASHGKDVLLMEAVLSSMPRRDQEVITSFYCHEQAPERICKAMSLSGTRFLLLKTRAKNSFAKALTARQDMCS